MYKIAVMGDYDSIYGFATLGLDTFPVTEPGEAGKLLRRLAEGQYRVLSRYKDELRPAIILIPGTSGNTGKGVERVKKSVEQAVGSDILFSDNE